MKKLTIENLETLSSEYLPGSPERDACFYLIDIFNDYDRPSDLFGDILNDGCASGNVPFLIHTIDCVNYYKKYKYYINDRLSDLFDSLGTCNLKDIFNTWDKCDPLAFGDYNRSLLAWFGFESAVRDIASNFSEVCDL